MAGALRFAILLAASSFSVLLAAAAASSSRSPPEVYGDETGRAALPAGNDDDDGTPTLRRWAMVQRSNDVGDMMQRFNVGTVLDFKLWSGPILLVRQADYERCSAASPLRRFADGGGGGGDTRFTLALPDAGLFYFISGVPARCEAGQRTVVRVVDPLNISGAPTPTPTPAPAPAQRTQPAHRRRPLSIAQKQMVAGALGFVAGFIAIFLLVGLPICCWP